ncbi:MAG: flagellar basal body L-ring protein FlgH [Nevskiaceae bacterium]|nr:MAG: flagellar basal body L-ring protein FlgH [Nevskiaceae bacterium]
MILHPRDEVPLVTALTAVLPWLTLIVAIALLTACASAPAKPAEDPLMATAVTTAPQAGAIYAPGGGIALFEDQHARNVGDVLTVLLVETTTAKTSAATNTAKDSSSSVGAPTVFGMPVTVNGKSVLSASLDSTHKFAGSGDSSQSNTLQGSVTVSVIGRQANGNLIVRGEKHLSLNQGAETIRIEGIVRPADIASDNTVPSSRVADARISYTGKGALAESNSKGWLTRFFSSPIWPF